MSRAGWAMVLGVAACGLMLARPAAAEQQRDTVTVGSKAFTESVILGEMLRELAGSAGVQARHTRQLGGTRVVWNALLGGEIDAYPEYTGTLLEEILVSEDLSGVDPLRRALASRGIGMTAPLGFNNTYAIGMRSELADRLGVKSISDLRAHPQLALGFGNEFMDRADGWPGLQRRYRLPQTDVRGLDHDLAYRGLEAGTLDAIDLYSTDAEIAYYELQALQDDLGFFPRYEAVVLYRLDLAERAPPVVAAFHDLAGRIDAAAMRDLNARVKLDGVSESVAAAAFLEQSPGLHSASGILAVGQTWWQRLWQRTAEHLALVGISLSAAILFAIPLGILAARRERIGQIVLGVAGVLQTIPSLAMFVFLIPLLGIGGPPAVVALFLYSLLPIIRNTYAGLTDIPAPIVESAVALGLPSGARLRIVELPLAARSVLAGIKTSAVINVGTATLGALIGAGGYGQPILTGIRLDDMGLILQGAVPAAVLALLVQGLFEVVERILLPRGLRLESSAVGLRE